MTIHRQAAGRVLVVTLDAPEVRNALDGATITSLREIFETLASRDPLPAGMPWLEDGPHRPHAVVLRATGPVFCAGAHLGEMKQLGQAGFDANLEAALAMGAMFRAVRNCPAPVVARVQGPAYGGGAGLVAACDLVVAAPEARFAFTEVRLGLVPGVIAPVVAGRLGLAATRRVFLTGAPLDAAAARTLGLVDEVASAADLDASVAAAVDDLLRGGPEALGRAKGLVDAVETLGYARSADSCARAIAEARTGSEGQAALAAFDRREHAPWVDETPWRLPPAPEAAP